VFAKHVFAAFLWIFVSCGHGFDRGWIASSIGPYLDREGDHSALTMITDMLFDEDPGSDFLAPYLPRTNLSNLPRNEINRILLLIYFRNKIIDPAFSPEQAMQTAFETYNFMALPENLEDLKSWVASNGIDLLCGEISTDYYLDSTERICRELFSPDLESSFLDFRNRTVSFLGLTRFRDIIMTSVGEASPTATLENFISFCDILRLNKKFTDELIPHDLFFQILKTIGGMETRYPSIDVLRAFDAFDRHGYPHPFTIDKLIEWLHPKHYIDMEFLRDISLAQEQDLEYMMRQGNRRITTYDTLIYTLMESRRLTVAMKTDVLRKLDEPNIISVKYNKANGFHETPQFRPLTRFQAYWALGGDGGPDGTSYLSRWAQIGEWSGFTPGIPFRTLQQLTLSACMGIQHAIRLRQTSFLDVVSMIIELNSLIDSIQNPSARIDKIPGASTVVLHHKDRASNWQRILTVNYANLYAEYLHH
jgi:hypothetical protein